MSKPTQQLSSSLTIFYKIVFPLLWSSILVGTMVFILIVSQDWQVVFIMLGLLVVSIDQVAVCVVRRCKPVRLQWKNDRGISLKRCESTERRIADVA